MFYSPKCVCVFSRPAKCFTAQEEMRNKTGKDRRLSLPLCPPLQSDFCFMACGCIKLCSNNLVSSGTETADISHIASVLYCMREDQQHTCVPCQNQTLQRFITLKKGCEPFVLHGFCFCFVKKVGKKCLLVYEMPAVLGFKCL